MEQYSTCTSYCNQEARVLERVNQAIVILSRDLAGMRNHVLKNPCIMSK